MNNSYSNTLTVFILYRSTVLGRYDLRENGMIRFRYFRHIILIRFSALKFFNFSHFIFGFKFTPLFQKMINIPPLRRRLRLWGSEVTYKARGPTAVNGQHLTRNIGALGSHQEKYGMSNLFGLGRPAQGDMIQVTLSVISKAAVLAVE